MKWWSRRAESPGDDVGTECEEFLSGRFARMLATRGEPVPAWAWLNQVAHATRQEVAALAATAGSPRRLGAGDWRAAVAAVALDLLWLAQNERALQLLQLEALVPVELALMGDQTALVGTPEELVRIARAALFGSPRLALGGAD